MTAIEFQYLLAGVWIGFIIGLIASSFSAPKTRKYKLSEDSIKFIEALIELKEHERNKKTVVEAFARYKLYLNRKL